ncbi:LysR family transcriptional regulator [Frigidibacter sp. MR17.24]|uniref:LysR family transcriptional regulator n=1 Tax=Frigidibacter sp. MR17.24 TaxID=3127345 RepID=UPI0030130418
MSGDSDMHFFVKLARRGSLAEAALDLGLTASAVSKRLARIEDRLGARLMNRTTRRIALTGEGEAYLLGALEVVARMDRLEQEIAAARGEPQGLLRVNATFSFGRKYIAPALAAFAAQHPGVEAQIVLSDAPLRLVEDGFDLQVRFGTPTALNSVSSLLLRNRRMLIASPAYLERHGSPRRLADLAQHACIVLRQETAAYDVWRFEDGTSVRVAGHLSTNDGEIAVDWVLAGQGIMMRSEWDVAGHVRAGRLRVLLPRHVNSADIVAHYPQRHNVSAKVRLFVDFLRRELRPVVPGLQLPEDLGEFAAALPGRR